MDWDDLRYLIAVADFGSLTGAASELKVNRTTVLRRIDSFERNHGVRVFERLPHGYVLTPAGDEILAAARGFENTIAEIERKLAGQDLRAEGPVHVTTTDTLLASVLPRALSAFRDAHPGITLEVTVSNRLLDLTRRDADVALRPISEAPENLVGRRVCSVAFAVYKASGRQDSDRWIVPDSTLSESSVARWIRKNVPPARHAFRLDSLLAMREMCAVGAGLAALPCYLGDIDDRLVRAHAPIPEMSTALWVLTHPDLKGMARVRLFVNHAVAALSRQRALFEGQRPRL